MKRVVSSSIITLFIILAIAITYFYLRNFRSSGGDPIKAIPADASFFLVLDPSVNNIDKFLHFSFWPVLGKSAPFAHMKSNLTSVDSLLKNNQHFSDFMENQPLYLSAHVTGANEFDFLFIKGIPGNSEESVLAELLHQIAGEDKQVEERNYDGNTIREIILNSKETFTYTVSKGVFIASFTPFLVEDALRQLKLGKPISADFAELKSDLNSSGSDLFVNYNNLPLLLNVFLESTGNTGITALRNFSGWTYSGFEVSANTIKAEGFSEPTDSGQFLNCFKGQQPVAMKLLKILPEKSAVINYSGFSDFNLYYQRFWKNYASPDQNSRKQKLMRSIAENYKLKIEDKLLEWIGNEYAMVILEPNGVNFDNNSFAVIKANKINEARNSLKTISRIVDKKSNSKTMEETYNGHVIGFVGLNGVLPVMFDGTFNRINKMYYTDIGDYIIFGNQASSIRMFIDEYKSGKLLNGSVHFESVQKQLSNGGNFLFYSNPSACNYILKSFFNSDWKIYLDQYKEILSGFTDFSIMMKNNGQKFVFSGVLNFSKGKKQEGVSQDFIVETDSSVNMKSLVTTDPVKGIRQILFQDDSDKLILIDNSGNTIWKNAIEGKILGSIFEIDLFKNNSRQFLFNTKEYLFLIDSDGKPVGNYPIRLPASATNGISVIDFDNKQDPRIYIACENKRVYAYLSSGKPLPGWNFQQSTGTVTDPVRTLHLGGKDFLVINDREGGVSIVNKFGETGISLIQGFTVAKNSEFYADPSGSVVTTDPSGNIVILAADGLVQTIPLNAAGPDHGFVYQDADNDGDPDYIFLDGKELTAYNKGLALIYRKEFDAPTTGQLQLLSLTDQKPALGFSSRIANKCWLVKLDGSVYPGFPVKGSGPIVIDELNMDSKKNLLIGSSENNFYGYSLE